MLSPANHFDCETVSLMGHVCDQAWLELRNEVFFPNQLVEEDVRRALAYRVLEAVNRGERNPEVLKSIALGAVEA